MAKVPVTKEVLAWAIRESGFTMDALRAEIGSDLDRWLTGEEQPSVTDLRQFANILKRPFAVFLLPSPPEQPRPAVEFRHPFQSDRREMNPDERRNLREAVRQQKVLAWLADELGQLPSLLPQFSLEDDPADAARALRTVVGVTAQEQSEWNSAAEGFRAWRAALERLGIFVFLFSMGRESCRGFSIWDDRAPVIGVNTGWNVEARTYSLIHELGHLITRTSSACVEGAKDFDAKKDPAERWCERFAAAFLIPLEALEDFLKLKLQWKRGDQIESLQNAQKVARRFRVSVRAAVLRLIDAKAAGWPLYRSIPPASDAKRDGGAPGEPRFRARIRQDQYGRRATSMFISAMGADVITRSDVMHYLDVGDRDVDEIQSALSP